MGIRARLLILAVGIAVPLSLVGAAGLARVWRNNRAQLDAGLRQQSELAAVAFARWIEAQRRPLTMLAAEANEQSSSSPQLAAHFRRTVETMPFWIDARLIDQAGKSLVAQPPGGEPPHPALIDHLLSEVRAKGSWVFLTDRTVDELRPVFTPAVPTAYGEVVSARVDGAAIRELFREIELSDRAILAVFDSQNRLLYRKQTDAEPVDENISGAPLFAALGANRTAVIEVASPYDGVRRVYGLARAGDTDCTVIVGIPSAALYEPARRQLYRHILFSLLALVCAVVAASLTARGIVLPIMRLRGAAHRIGAGDFAARAATAGGSEIVELGAAFNAMAARIAEREERLTELDRLKSEFVSSVSHELRTPLTTIKTLTRVLQRGGLSDDEQRDYLETISEECDRQIDLVLNLLDLSRIESGAYRVTPARVSPAEIIESCARVEAHAAGVRGIKLTTELPAEAPDIRTDRDALRRVVCSLVENAIKYTPEGGRITISATRTREPDTVEITVKDTGCGIMAEDMPYVFDKFFRGRAAQSDGDANDPHESSSAAAVPGIGLGLYLARTIAEQLDAAISVQSPPQGESSGAAFIVSLPVWNESGGAVKAGEESNVEAVAGG